MRKRTSRYIPYVPKSIPPGRVLAHNHIRHTVDMPPGVNGFRAWTWPKGKHLRHFLRCNCGWPHYATRDHAKRYKCESWKTIQSYTPWLSDWLPEPRTDRRSTNV
jgi:hypothetical protein